jgi:Protein of unknown function (DUF559)
VANLADPASESPMETRLRMVLVLGGLPRPQAQMSLHDGRGRFLGRPDLYYPEHHLGLEYDGGVHRASLAEDNRRQNRLLAAGIRLLRFTAGDVLHNPDSIRTQVRTMLSSRPIAPVGPGSRAFAAPSRPASAGSGGFPGPTIAASAYARGFQASKLRPSAPTTPSSQSFSDPRHH